MPTKHLLTASGNPRFVALNGDASVVVCAGDALRRFRVRDGKLLATAPLTSGAVAFATSRDRTRFAVATSKSIEVRDERTLGVLLTARVKEDVGSLAFSPDGRVLAARAGANIVLYRAKGLKRVAEFRCNDQMWDYDVAFVSNDQLAATSKNGVDLFTVQSGRRAKTLKLGENDMPDAKGLAFVDGRLFVTSNFFSYAFDPVRKWAHKRIRCEPPERAVPVVALGLLISGDNGGRIDVADLRTGAPVRRLHGHSSALTSLDVDPAGRWLVSAAADGDGGAVRLWDLQLALADRRSYTVTGDELCSFDFPNAGGVTFESGGQALWAVRRGAIERRSPPDFEVSRTFPFEGGQGGVQFLPPEDAFAGLWVNGTNGHEFPAIRLDLRQQRAERIFTFPFDYPALAQLNRSRSVVAAFSSDALCFVSYPDGRLLRSVRTHDGPIEDSQFSGLQFSPDERFLYTSGRDGTLNEWLPETGEISRSYRGEGSIESFCLSPGGKWLAISEAHRIVILDRRRWKALLTIAQPRRVHWSSMAMSADGALLAFASTHDKEIRLYDAKSGKPTGMLNGHGSGVNGLTMSPSGQFVASTSDDQTLKVWKVS